MIRDIEMCALIVRIDPRFQCAASTGTGVAHCESDFREIMDRVAGRIESLIQQARTRSRGWDFAR